MIDRRYVEGERMTAHHAHRQPLAIALPTLAALVVSLLVAGCGQTLPTGGATAPDVASSATSRLPSPPSSDSVTSAQSEDVDGLFAELAATSQPMTIFAPTALPEDAVLADRWFPVLESQDSGAYDGPPAGNPQVLGSGADSEIQVIFQAGDGWLAILENFRGDLGDVTGTPVGFVAGNAATLYEVNGGELVQWSQDGRWYGVFGRGIGKDDTVAIALGMQPRSAQSR
jgi:hypothetical protein